MNYLKSHFRYTKHQRNGIFLLLIAVLSVQFVLRFVDFPQSKSQITISQFEEFRKEMDSLMAIRAAESKPRQYLFNPNYLTEYGAYVLGLNEFELLRLENFRKEGKYINTGLDFQRVTKISDSLLASIRPRIKFTNKKKLTKLRNKKGISKSIQIGDLNKATATEFQKVYGIGKILSERIVKYRTLLGGFTFEDQIFEVWNLEKETATSLLEHFKIFEIPEIEIINVNTATFKEIYNLPYTDYELTKKIVEYRTEVAEIQSIEELKKIDGFPLDKFDRIALYLGAK